MSSIQNLCIGTITLLNKVIASFSCVLAITVIALSIIGLVATPSGPFNAIVQYRKTTNEILLGTSIFVFILGLVWITALCKKTKKQSVSQSEPSQSRPSRLGLSKPESLKHKSPSPTLAPVIEEINSIDFLSKQPQEIILKILGYLSAIELAKCSEFSRRFRRLASNEKLWDAVDLRNISPLIKVFNELDWFTHFNLRKHGISLEDAPSLDKRQIIPVLKSYLSSLQIEENEGITFLTIPKGLTFNKLVKLTKEPKIGNTSKFGHIAASISNEIGDAEVDQTYQIVITNNVLEKSRNLSFSDQKAFLETIGCVMPMVLEATVLLVITFMVSEKRLYNDNPRLTYTRCSEQVNGLQLIVGGLSPDGVCVYDSPSFDVGSIGVGGVLRKF